MGIHQSDDVNQNGTRGLHIYMEKHDRLEHEVLVITCNLHMQLYDY